MIDNGKQGFAAPAQTSPEQRWRRFATSRAGAVLFVSGALVAIASLLLYSRFVPASEPLTMTEVESGVSEMLAAVTPGPAYSVQVYDVILPSLVLIQIDDTGAPGESVARSPSSMTRSAFEAGAFDAVAFRSTGVDVPPYAGVQTQQYVPIGSGVVVSDDGAILTAYHVIERGGSIDVTFADGTEAHAAVAAVMPDNNIAVLQPDKLPEVFAPATLGNPGAVYIGDDVYAVGNPLGLSGSISAGIVSGLDRTYRRSPDEQPLRRLIQFDSAVNAGSAGGPLLNRDGEVVGIVVGPVNPTADETFIGIGFAVRIDVAGSAAGAPEL